MNLTVTQLQVPPLSTIKRKRLKNASCVKSRTLKSLPETPPHKMSLAPDVSNLPTQERPNRLLPRKRWTDLLRHQVTKSGSHSSVRVPEIVSNQQLVVGLMCWIKSQRLQKLNANSKRGSFSCENLRNKRRKLSWGKSRQKRKRGGLAARPPQERSSWSIRLKKESTGMSSTED